MKKLMIAAAIVCAAAFVQAATFSWDLSTITLSDGEGVGMDGTLEVISGTTSIGTYDVVEGFIAEGVAEFDAGDLSWKLTTTSFGDGTYEKIVTVAGFNHPYPDAGSAADASQSLLNLGSVLSNEAMSYGNLFFSDGASGAAENDWTPVASPEPTSGLLLLIGVAGLALRRRRA